MIVGCRMAVKKSSVRHGKTQGKKKPGAKGPSHKSARQASGSPDRSKAGIACGGIWVVDMVKVIDLYPQENSIAYISEASRGGGGCAHNVVIESGEV